MGGRGQRKGKRQGERCNETPDAVGNVWAKNILDHLTVLTVRQQSRQNAKNKEQRTGRKDIQTNLRNGSRKTPIASFSDRRLLRKR